MKTNMGTSDRFLRIAFALLIGVLYGGGFISGTLAIILGIVAIIFVLTGIFSFCPLYSLFGINTCKTKQ